MNISDNFPDLRLEDFLNLTTDAVIMIDQNQTILVFNKSAREVFGYEPAEIIGQPLSLLLPPDKTGVHAHLIHAFAESSKATRLMAERKEISGRRKDGCIFPIEASIARFSRNGRDYFSVFLKDISARKKTEEDLKKWAQAFEQAEWGVAIGRAEANTLETFNPAFARIYGYSKEELTGKPIRDVYSPEERPKLDGWIQQAHELGHISYETIHLRKDGTTFPALVDITAAKDSQGKVLYRVVNVLDITERKKAELALRDSEERNVSMISAMEEGITLMDASGSIVACNASAERILGLTESQIVGSTPMDPLWQVVREDGSPFHPQDRPAMVTLRSGEPCSNVIMGVSKPDGTLTWISANTRPLCHRGESRPYAVLTSFADITDRRQMVQVLEQRVAESTQKLSALLEISRDLASTLELKPLLALILRQLKTVVDFTGAAIARLVGDEFVTEEYLGPIPQEIMLGFKVPASNNTSYAQIERTRQPVIIADIWKEHPWQPNLKALAGSEMWQFYRSLHAWLGVPLIAHDRFIGILRLDHTEPDHFSAENVQLVLAFARIAATAIENASLYEQAQSLAALQERQKLARELHDSVSQALYGISLGISAARTLLDRDPPRAAEPLEYAHSLAEAGMAEMRALIFELRPESLEMEGLVAALAKQCAALQARYSFQVETSFCDEPDLPILVKEALYRIAQEALQNVVKHAHATRVELSLFEQAGRLCLEIKDNGLGFDPAGPFPGHLGLSSMRERIFHSKGNIQIESSPGRGTLIRVAIPYGPG